MSPGTFCFPLSIVLFTKSDCGALCQCSQNHQYALKLQDPFPVGWEPFFINCNDSSVEGIKSTDDSGKKVWGVQFHPESAGGPLDTIEVRDELSLLVVYSD